MELLIYDRKLATKINQGVKEVKAEKDYDKKIAELEKVTKDIAGFVIELAKENSEQKPKKELTAKIMRDKDSKISSVLFGDKEAIVKRDKKGNMVSINIK